MPAACSRREGRCRKKHKKTQKGIRAGTLECGDWSPLFAGRLVAVERRVRLAGRARYRWREHWRAGARKRSRLPTATSRLGKAVTSHRTPNDDVKFSALLVPTACAAANADAPTLTAKNSTRRKDRRVSIFASLCVFCGDAFPTAAASRRHDDARRIENFSLAESPRKNWFLARREIVRLACARCRSIHSRESGGGEGWLARFSRLREIGRAHV